MLTSTPADRSTAALDAQADAFIRLRELSDRGPERRDAAISAERLGSELYQRTGDATRLVEALHIWAGELRDRLPDRAAEELERMVALRGNARLAEHFWAITAMDRLGVDVVRRWRY